MQNIKIDYPILKLLLSTNPSEVVVALHDKQTVRIDSGSFMLAGTFANLFQAEVLDKGDYMALLPYFNQKEWECRTINVKFAATKNIAYKEIELTFAYLVQAHERGFWINIPILQTETFAATLEEIETAAEEAIKLDFAKNKRFEYLQNVISVIWYEPKIELVKETVDLTTYTLSELDNLKESKKKSMLPTVAELLEIKTQQLFGYEKELKQLADTLKGQYNRSTILVGKSGVGKTCLMWELSRQKQKLGVKARIWETTASVLIKELTQNTGWQQNLTLLCQELRQAGDILFVRNLLELFEVGQYEGNSISMAEYIREYVSRGEVTLVGECTDEELARIDMRNPNFSQLFTLLRIEEPSKDMDEIILNKVSLIAKTQKVQLEPEAVRETVRLNRRYTPYSGFPGKPIRFLESILMNPKELAQQNDSTILDRAAVLKSFCYETGMPEFMLNPQINMDLVAIEKHFNQNVFGQTQAVGTLVNILASIKAAVLRQGKPIASLLFVGPTGVGKTELAKILAEFMFGSRDKMIRFDMSEFSSAYSIGRLTGESYFSDGLLTSAVRREPFCVLLFDELEKAHPDFNDLLLQMLGEGRLTDSQGKVVNFCSTIIIMTSNMGAQKLQTQNIGWNAELNGQEIADFFENEARKNFRPEIFNRIDQIVPFHPLPLEVIRHVVEREIAQLKKREGILGRKMDWHFQEGVYQYLGEKGYHPKYGARALQRTMREELTIPLCKKLNEYSFDEQLVLNIKIIDNQIDINVVVHELKMDLMLEELAQNEFMDYASNLRYKIYQLFEGNTYVQFGSEISTLKREQKEQPKVFWDSGDRPRKLAYYSALEERFAKAKQEVDSFETEMALISMALKPLNTKFYDQIKNWDSDYFLIKLELLGLLKPEFNSFKLGCYGEKSKEIFKFYQQLVAQKNYDWEAQTVWYRASLYEEMVTVKHDSGEIEGENIYVLENEETNISQPQKTAAKIYFKQKYSADLPEKEMHQNFQAKEKGDIFLGVEMLVMGYGVAIFLEEEHGMQRIQHEESDTAFHKVLVVATAAHNEHIAPNDIHRKNSSHWIARPRRTFHRDAFEDHIYDLKKRKVAKNEPLSIVLEVLDKRFSERLDLELQY